MSGWVIVAIVAVIMWGIVQMQKARSGIISDEYGKETYVPRDDPDARLAAEETRREIEQLRERLQVLERIATDANTMDAKERARIAAEIEALRGPDEPETVTDGDRSTSDDRQREEQGK